MFDPLKRIGDQDKQSVTERGEKTGMVLGVYADYELDSNIGSNDQSL